MKQFRVTGIDNRTNKPLQAMIDANDEAEAYKMARRQFATIDRIDRIVSAPVAPGAATAGRGQVDSDGPDLDDLEDDEEEDDRMPDLSTFDLEAPRVSGGLKGLLRRYLGQRLGLAMDGQERHRVAKLMSVSDDVISVRLDGNNLAFHFPIRGIIAAVETSPGNATPTTSGQTPGLIIEVPRMAVLRLVGEKPSKP